MATLLERLSVEHLKRSYTALKAQYSSHPDIAVRLERAMDILTKDTGYSISITKNTEDMLLFEIESPNGVYQLDFLYSTQLGSCNCPDGQKLCKHRIAIKLLLESARSMKQAGLSIKEQV